MYRENNNGPRTVPCGTPDKTGAHPEVSPFTTARCGLRKESIHLNAFLPMPLPNNLPLRVHEARCQESSRSQE